MAVSGRHPTEAEPVERFKPTSGSGVGFVGLAVVAVGIGYVAFRVHTVTGLQVALALAFFGVVIWVTQLRPRAAVYPHVVLLKNSLVDHLVPLHLVDDVTVTRTLNVWVDEQRYVCIGIGSSLRSLVQGRTTARPLGSSRLHDYAETARAHTSDQTAMSYQKFVATRTLELADRAKRAPDPAAPTEVVRRLAWPEIAALVVIGFAFVASLLL